MKLEEIKTPLLIKCLGMHLGEHGTLVSPLKLIAFEPIIASKTRLRFNL